MTHSSSPGSDPAYLRPTWFIDSDHPEVQTFARQAAGGARNDAERAVRLFYAVRDGIRYDPYTSSLDPETFKASLIVGREASFCVPKAILLAAAARSLGIASRLGFADVRNHLATRRLLRILGTDLFVFHGYTELLLGSRWVKATPTFNLSLCERFGVKPLEFDGCHDAMLHACDREGRRHMEYVLDRGRHADLPLEEIGRGLREAYPQLFDEHGAWIPFSRSMPDFEAEAARETPEAP